MVGADAGRDGELEVLGAGETLGSQVAGVEASALLAGSITTKAPL
jgi:hypothetical protein